MWEVQQVFPIRRAAPEREDTDPLHDLRGSMRLARTAIRDGKRPPIKRPPATAVVCGPAAEAVVKSKSTNLEAKAIAKPRRFQFETHYKTTSATANFLVRQNEFESQSMFFFVEQVNNNT
mmetsp:Transcript_18015/g.45045  ORF Transcript_18015/g.45045 Transcript_18015/m.45045 type:complete len:120 (-) Transcript_18015:707-1066(-)